MSSPTNTRGPSLVRIAWLTVLFLWPVALLNYLDRQMLASMKSTVMADIADIGNDENWGFMLSQFKWVYAFLSPIGGIIADKLSRKWTIVVSLFCWSVVTWLTGHVESYDQLKITRALMGVSEAFYIPAALALIAEVHGERTRSRAIGIHQTAIYFGLILGGFGGYAADTGNDGWRHAFSGAGIVGVTYALALPWLLRDAQPGHIELRLDHQSLSRETASSSNTSLWKELVANWSFWLLVTCFTLPAIAGWIVKDWMPAILEKKFQIGQGIAGVSATLYVNIAALSGAFYGGWIADRWHRRTSRGRIYVSAAGMALMIPALLGIGSSGTLVAAILYLITFGIGWGFFDANNMPILSQIVHSRWRATGYGIMNFVSITFGGFADWGFGWLSDRDISLRLTFGVFAAVALLSVFLVLLIKPREECNSSIHNGAL